MIEGIPSSQRAPSPLPALIITTLVLGGLVVLLALLAGGIQSATFLQFGVVLAAFVYLATFIDIRLGIAILIVCIAFSPKNTVSGMYNVRLEDFILPALWLAWLLRQSRTRQAFTPTQIGKPFLSYLAMNLVACLMAISLSNIKPGTSVPILGKNIEYFLIFLVLLNNIRTYAEFKSFLIFVLLISVVSALISGAPVVGQAVGPRHERVGGPSGELANIFGGYLILNIAVLTGIFVHAVASRTRVLAVLGLAPLCYSLMFTYSRTSWAALILGIGVFAALKYRKLLLILLGVLVLFPIVAPSSVFSRFATITTVITDKGPESWEARTSSWNDAIDQIIASPIVGNGLGSIPFGDVDNEYVRVVVDMGIIGLGILLWLLLRIAWVTHKAYDALTSPGLMKGYMAGYYMAFLCLVFHCSGATSLTTIRSMEMFMILSALAMSLIAHREEWEKEEQAEISARAHQHSEGAMMHRR